MKLYHLLVGLVDRSGYDLFAKSSYQQSNSFTRSMACRSENSALWTCKLTWDKMLRTTSL